MSDLATYRPLIGLEIHVELKTQSKMFCQCRADWFGMEPNTNTCPVCLGLPGALPVPNKQAIEWIIKIGRALGCQIRRVSKFDRKHYFYPDLPKGYQISQYDEPFCEHGALHLFDGRSFRIRRVHMEEDTGKLIHTAHTKVDFNRSGVPLVEIVTEADFTSSEDVKMFLEELHTIIRYLDVSDADMERGSMRLEPNISVRRPGEEGFPPYKVEVKNINSFSFVKKAIDYEVTRQTTILEGGEIPKQETRGYQEDKGITVSQRSKENAEDYRYFPEPDIPPFVLPDEFVEAIQLPELPIEKMHRYTSALQVRESDAFILTRDVQVANYFEAVLAESQMPPQTIANLIVNKKIAISIPVEEFVTQAKSLSAPRETDMAQLATCIADVIAHHEKAVADYRAGKSSVIMFLVGQVMRQMAGRAAADLVKSELEQALA